MAIDTPHDRAEARARRAGTRPLGAVPAAPVPAVPVAPQVDVDRVTFDALREPEVVAHVLDSLRAGSGGVVVTPNVDILRQLRTPELAPLAEDAELVVADGMPIVWASRIVRDELPERVTGSSLIWTLSAGAAAQGRSIYLLGGAPGVAEEAGRTLADAAPGLRVAGWSCPPFGFERSEAQLAAVRADVAAAKPDIVFVGLGFPKQERLAYTLRRDLPGAWFVGCGGALAMVAGQVPRAPQWAQRSGLEWVHRLAHEPGRMAKRYLVHDAPYAVGLMTRSILVRLRVGLRRREWPA